MTLAKGRLSLVILFALALTSCQTEDKPPQPRFVSDARGGAVGESSQKRDGQYFIEFRSRYALSYGHTYVIFGRLNKAGGMVNPEVAGLAPATNDTAPYVLGHFLPVPAETGASDGDLEEAYRSASWRVLLTPSEYDETVAFIRKLKAKTKFWQASVYNCNAFVAEIARSMGYKAPSIWLRPQQFVTQLREMNT
ncbi:hypothetical protein SAMN02927900_01003 [Rhizobium mongolense subsp. loessense]|uniref:Permuted papain-like amidase YaeF/Yiix C92 family enzyme n=1 Tax=Rhizobium mongolense subsp. loessense TaxID=158890 RepID=A0A1G4PUS1_9HYPH|nr:hypothetical protein [Rhizobium mongolense]SCW36114.1 hypothetical protein SAMN02927900_01003 [Rhizobium mongolense subsp. loessense]